MTPRRARWSARSWRCARDTEGRCASSPAVPIRRATPRGAGMAPPGPGSARPVPPSVVWCASGTRADAGARVGERPRGRRSTATLPGPGRQLYANLEISRAARTARLLPDPGAPRRSMRTALSPRCARPFVSPWRAVTDSPASSRPTPSPTARRTAGRPTPCARAAGPRRPGHGLQEVFLAASPRSATESVTHDVLRVVRDLCDNRLVVVGLQSGAPACSRAAAGHTVEEGSAPSSASRRPASSGVDLIFGLPGERRGSLAHARGVAHLTSICGARITPTCSPRSPAPAGPRRRRARGRRTLALLEELLGRGSAAR